MDSVFAAFVFDQPKYFQSVTNHITPYISKIPAPAHNPRKHEHAPEALLTLGVGTAPVGLLLVFLQGVEAQNFLSHLSGEHAEEVLQLFFAESFDQTVQVISANGFFVYFHVEHDGVAGKYPLHQLSIAKE